MENRPSNVKVALINGIYLGVALIFFNLILYVIGVDREHWIQYLSFLIMLIGVFLAQKNWRDKYNEGFLTYGQAFSNGFLTILFSSIITAIYSYVFFEFLAPAEHLAILETAEESIYDGNPNISDEEFEMAWKWTKMMTSTWMLAIWGILGGVFGGLIISAITSIFVKKEPQQFV
jgi:hypothetical protein